MIKLTTRLQYLHCNNNYKFSVEFQASGKKQIKTNTSNDKLLIGYKESQRMAEVSKRLSKCLDRLGYNQDLIKFRRHFFLEMNQNLSKLWHGYTHLTAGSKAEGIAAYYESDVDRLVIRENVKCLEEGRCYSNFVVFHMDKERCSPGYTRLKLYTLTGETTSDEVQNCLVQENGETYISNKFTESTLQYSEYGRNAHRVDVTGAKVEYIGKRGPCVIFRSGTLKYDFVSGFECFSPDLLEKWVRRKRYFGWPDSRLIKRISTLESHVVPAANAESHFPDSEWRICFTKAELVLVDSLNEHQMKVYILLKQFTKTDLEPICPTITSYIVKNVIFWLAENTPKELFAEELLLFRLMDALQYLQECINCNTLKSYMIADRNLLFARITTEQKQLLISKLNQLMNEKEHILRNLKKICYATDNFETSTFLKEAEKREIVERLILRQCVMYIKLYKRTYTKEEFLFCLKTNKEYASLEKELYELVLPDLKTESHNEEFMDLYRKRLFNLLQ